MIPSFIQNKLKNSELAESSINNYMGHLKKYIGDKEWNDNLLRLDMIKDYTKTLHYKSREGFLSAITYAYDAHYEHIRQKIRNLVNEAKNDAHIESVKNLKHIKEEKILFEEMKKIAEIDQRSIIDNIIAKLYTLEVPLRANTWSLTRVIDVEDTVNVESDPYNYIDLHTGVLILNQYKTVKTYGRKTIQVNEELIKYLRDKWYSKGLYIGNIQKWLIPSRDGNQMKAAILNKHIKKIFGYGSSVCRHSYISYRRRMGAKDESMKELAQRMNTSFLQVSLVYDDTNTVLKSESDDSDE